MTKKRAATSSIFMLAARIVEIREDDGCGAALNSRRRLEVVVRPGLERGA